MLSDCLFDYTLADGHIFYAILLIYMPSNSLQDNLLFGELAVFCGSLIGAGLGFLWFNASPAQIFMGDTGSLALGAVLATIAIITKHELTFIVVSGVFVFETQEEYEEAYKNGIVSDTNRCIIGKEIS